MKLFSPSQIEQINEVAKKSNEALKPAQSSVKIKGLNEQLQKISQEVIEYFKDSKAILITTKEQLHLYVDNIIAAGYAGIDTETTGLDRVHDTIVGSSLYYPGGVECYIPNRHLIPIFDEPYKNQLTYEECQEEFQRLADASVRLIFANADFDLAMIFKDYKVDFNDNAFFDVILAWRCLKENERDNALKVLYNKYVLKGAGDPKKFSDLFPVKLFPYCKPQVAKLYAANDAKITFELFQWQLPYLTVNSPKCRKNHLESIANLFWNVEMPMVKVCQNMHRTGMYLDKTISDKLVTKYQAKIDAERAELAEMVQDIIDKSDPVIASKRPFASGKEFNPNSSVHTKYLVYTMLKVPDGKNRGTGKEDLTDLNLPVTNQILKLRSTLVLMNTFVKKMPQTTTSDSRIHAQFKQIGADCITGDSIVLNVSGYTTMADVCQPMCEEDKVHYDFPESCMLYFLNKLQYYERPAYCVRYTDCDTIRIETQNGYHIEGTFNHPIMVRGASNKDDEFFDEADLQMLRHYEKLENIQTSDQVCLSMIYHPNTSRQDADTLLKDLGLKREQLTNPNFSLTLLGKFLGMLYSFRNTISIQMYGKVSRISVRAYPRILNEFISVCKGLFEYCIVSTCPNDRKYIDKCIIHEDDCDILLTDINIYQIMKCIHNLDKGRSIFWKSSLFLLDGFISGLVSDAVFTEGGDQFYLRNLSSSVSDMVHIHLLSHHIVSRRIKASNPSYYFIWVNSDYWKNFLDVLNHTEGYNANLIRNYCNTHYVLRCYDNYVYDPVVKITRGRNTVYDFHMPGTHSFISNGMISHNTGRMSSAEPNVQNLPSHATDIRHMFRATASSHKNVDCVSNDEHITVSLHELCKVTTREGRKSVRDLVVGDVVKLLCGTSTSNHTLISKELVDNPSGVEYNLVFELKKATRLSSSKEETPNETM